MLQSPIPSVPLRFAIVRGLAFAWVATWSLAPIPSAAAEPKTPAEDVEFFEKEVRPILANRCQKCHGEKTQKGGLRLDSRAAVVAGGATGPAVVPHKPSESLLVDAINYGDTYQMPPKSKLPAPEIATLTRWVERGVPWAAETAPQTTGVTTDFNLKERAKHWSFQPLKRTPIPTVKDAGWPRSTADRFLLAKLEAEGLHPAGDADKRTLLRRVTFDLVGLPPTPDEVAAYLKDETAEAFSRVVDRLLDSPQFGERWGRHWLDLVRYAESRGHEFDYPSPNAHQYRDYVIRALNADVPYNQFVTEHLAGDLVDPPRRHPQEGFNESILGTGFWFLGEQLHSPVDVRQDEADRFDNMVDVMSKTFLGLTLACARCHDHKFDAISTRDYYAVYGFLQSSSYRLVRFDSKEKNRQVAEELAAVRSRHRVPLQRALVQAVRPTVERLPDLLLAARETLLAGGADESKLRAIPDAHRVDGAHVARWVAYLKGVAQNQPDDILRPWLEAACAPEALESQRLSARLRPVLKRWQAAETVASNALEGGRVVVDFGRLAGPDWMPDDVAFGLGPVRAGEPRFGSDGVRSIIGFAERAGAEFDATWDRLKLAAGSENEPGKVGGLSRAGRTIRTPTFELKSGKIYYLIRGKGQAYAAVDSHMLINGPLHGQLVLPVDAGEGYRWVAHDLSAYAGHRTHVEFTAAGTNFAVATVVQSERPPGPISTANTALLRCLESEAAPTLESLASAYGRCFQRVLDRLNEDRLASAADGRELGALANWILQHSDLFPQDGAGFQQATAAFCAEQSKPLGEIRAESRVAPAMLDGSGEDERVFVRGSHKVLGPVVPRRFLEALAGPDGLSVSHGSGRLEWARQITDPKLDPFVPRVFVNRIWHHLFGRGIVASVDNFGVLGEAPTHPELLDALAFQFIDEGWSLKRLVRSLVLSRAYQMAAQSDAASDKADPQNLWLHRMRIRRLEGEAIRDAMLTLSGRLDLRQFGPPVPVALTPFMEGRGRPQGGPLDGEGRRSVYTSVRRNFLSPFMLAFDTPIPFSTVGRRTVSNVPAQALILMNDPFVHQQAELWAKRVLAQRSSPRERITSMYQSAFTRPPTDAEAAACLEFVKRQAELSQASPEDLSSWADVAHLLFNAKEFIFVN